MRAKLLMRIGGAIALVSLVAATLGNPVTDGAGEAVAVDVAATTAVAVPWHGSGQAPCPEGFTRRSSAATESFDDALPQARFNNGFYRVGSALGGAAARSLMPEDGSNTRDHLFLDWASVTPGARTMLGFGTRGTTQGGYYATVDVNSRSVQVPVGSTSWSGRVYDVTSATDDEGGRLGTWFQHRAQSGQSTYWDVDNIQIYTCRSAPVSRIAGSNRYATSAQVSARFPAGAAVAYLALGTNYPDALGGAALAGSQEAPVLLVTKDTIPDTVANELSRLRPERIVVLGGTAAISDDVRDAAARYATTGQVDRLGGATRFETSARIAAEFAPGLPVVYVATGRAYPDALAGGALAGHQGVPVLLTELGTLPDPIRSELERIRPGRIVVLGGSGSVSDAVLSQLSSYTTGSVTRLAGEDRYQTAARIAAEFPTGSDQVYLATGANYPDALSGAAIAGTQGVPVLLSRQRDLPGPSRAALLDLSASTGIVLGGAGSLNAVVLDQLGGYVG